MNTDEIKDVVKDEIKVQGRGLFDFLIHSNMHFEGKKDHEKIIVFARRHWFVLLNTIFGGIFASILPLFLIIFIAKFLVKYHLSNVFTLFWVIYIMLIWIFVFYELTMYVLDAWIVTDERILDIAQVSLFNRKVSELHLDSIEDISVHTNGFIESYLNFGDIEIQTAGADKKFLFDQVPKPLEIKDHIMNASKMFDSVHKL